MTKPEDPRDPDASIGENEASEASGPQDAREALDALLSAERDRALEPGEAARLAELLAADRSATHRRNDFDRFDATFRAYGRQAIPQPRLDRIESALVRRLAESGVAGAAARVRASRRRRIGFGLAAAAMAAGIVLASLVWRPRSEGAVDETRGPTPQLAAGDSSPATPEVDDLATFGLEDASDLEVIEELELLEFLAAREREAGEPQG